MSRRAPVAAAPAVLRCAIYTRKSSEEGLEQSFNSLHAQREACEAYVRSQAGEGWTALGDHYDDGGFSGGSMQRPALAKLLTDVRAAKLDVVVIYKIDRLTRSLADFAKIVEILDASNVSIVSVTQPFNTTTSMGRLTLNVLLSFAQFEREVTGERIRDKIAQSKAKGMWMGGSMPLGYDVRDRLLQVNEPEAERVRQIFIRYLKLGSVHTLCEELRRTGVKSKAWTSSKGRPIGGLVLSRGALYHLLRNRHYLGEVTHRDLCHPGQHAAIVERKLFDQVQARLDKHRVRNRRGASKPPQSPLTGLIYDADGGIMSPTFSMGRGKRLYRYYTSSLLQRGDRPERDGVIRRVSADALERFLLATLRRLSNEAEADWEDLRAMILRVEVRTEDTQLVLSAAELFGADHPELAFEDLQARLSEGERAVWEGPANVRIGLPLRMQFRGGRVWLVGGEAPRLHNGGHDLPLIRALKEAHEVLRQHGAAPTLPVHALREASAPKGQYNRRLMRLAFLAPDIQCAVLAGTQPPGLTVKAVFERDVPLDWQQQRRRFGC